MRDRCTMRAPIRLFALLDIIALVFFVGAWIGYAFTLEWTTHGPPA